MSTPPDTHAGRLSIRSTDGSGDFGAYLAQVAPAEEAAA